MSALKGDNVVEPQRNMPWFDGPSLLEHLETVEVGRHRGDAPFRLPVQHVIRPDQDFRGYAGQIASGAIGRAMKCMVVPAGRQVAGEVDHNVRRRLE